MPTFILIKNHEEVERITGAHKPALTNAIQTHAPPAPAPTSLGEGSSKDESAASKDVRISSRIIESQ